MGLCVSAVMKHADNMVKVFAASLAMFLSSLLSTLFFELPPSFAMLVAFGVASIANFLYLGGHNRELLSLSGGAGLIAKTMSTATTGKVDEAV
jgi:hypothetical protein